jgi:hypothetical protein
MTSPFEPFTADDIAPDMPAAGGPDNMPGPPDPFDMSGYDIEQIKANLVTDRAVKLDVPRRMRNPNFEYRFINTTPGNYQRWYARGFREVTDPALVQRYRDLHGGVKDGHAFGTMLIARPKVIGDADHGKSMRQYREMMSSLNPRTQNPIRDMPDQARVAEQESNLTGNAFMINLGVAGTIDPGAVEHMRKMRANADKQAQDLTSGRGAI